MISATSEGRAFNDELAYAIQPICILAETLYKAEVIKFLFIHIISCLDSKR
jgi:hypothetical protein